MTEGNGTESTAQNRQAPALTLVSSDNEYPFPIHFAVEDPYAWDVSLLVENLTKAIKWQCQVAEVKDYKLIETNGRICLRFQNEIDEMHYFYVDHAPPGEWMAGVYKTDAVGDQEHKKQQKLRRRFCKAAKKVGLRDHMDVAPSDDGESVVFYADTLSNYFKIWGALPERRKATLVRGECSAFTAEDTPGQDEHNSLRIA